MAGADRTGGAAPGKPGRRMRIALCLMAVLMVFGSASTMASSELGFSSSLTPALIADMVVRFGPRARHRLAAWEDFARGQRGTGKGMPSPAYEKGQVQAVNSFINTVPWRDDQSHWGQEDYWATPAETLASHGGDCEDLAIAKYFLLREIGVPIGRMRITYVRAATIKQPHMVLSYYPEGVAEPLILDNLHGEVRAASARPDLIPVYSFNDDEVRLVEGNRTGRASQIRMWRGFLERLEKERAR